VTCRKSDAAQGLLLLNPINSNDIVMRVFLTNRVCGLIVGRVGPVPRGVKTFDSEHKNSVVWHIACYDRSRCGDVNAAMSVNRGSGFWQIVLSVPFRIRELIKGDRA
jgi:hypothetical protein